MSSIYVFDVQRINAAELLRLYLDYNLLSEAADLATEYIKATLGAGKEYFGLTVSIYLFIFNLALFLNYGDVITSE